MTRKLRIAAALVCGLLTVTFCIFWLRSYSTFDRVVIHGGDGIMFISYRGKFFTILPYLGKPVGTYWQTGQAALEPQFKFTPWDGPSYLGFAWLHRAEFNALPNTLEFGTQYGLVGRSWTSIVDGIIVPYYFLTAVALISTLAACLSRWPRFSLRTLLLATTLLAVALAVGVRLVSAAFPAN